MKTLRLLSFGLLQLGLSATAPLWAAAPPATSAVPKIIILPARVTVDGVARPDLGQSLSDIIIARLLTSSAVTLLDADTVVPDPAPLPSQPSATSAGAPGPGSLSGPAPLPLRAPGSRSATPSAPAVVESTPASPGPTPISAGLAMGADLVVQPTAVGHGEGFHLTLREIKIPGGTVVSLISEKTATGLKGLYALAENHALRLVPARPSGPRLASAPSIIDHPASYRPDPPRPPAQPPVTEQEIATAPPALEKLSPAKQAAINATLRLLDPAASAAGPAPIGRLGGLDAAWSFCTITLKQPLELPVGTALFATAGGNPENVIDLRVTRLEGRKIIADFAPGPLAAALRPGDTVYYWKPFPRGG